MATARDCIKLALRKLRVIGQGESPDSDQITQHLTDLNALMREWMEDGTSWPFVSVAASGPYEVRNDYPAVRVQCLTGGVTITAPKGTLTSPVVDGFRIAIVDVANAFDTSAATFARNGWKIEGAVANLTLNTEALSRIWMFRADLGDWKRVADITIDQDIPFPSEFDQSIALLLAKRLQGEYGQALAPPDANAARHARIKLYARYAKPLTAQQEISATYLGSATKLSRIVVGGRAQIGC